MFRFLLGVLVGSVATAIYLDRHAAGAALSAGGRVDELASAADNPVADPALNAGDGTPQQPSEVRT